MCRRLLLCSFALCSLAWMRSPRRNGSFGSTSLHHIGQAIESGPVWQPVYLGVQPQTHKPGLHALVKPARLACMS
jgi:hypothetical protein